MEPRHGAAPQHFSLPGEPSVPLYELCYSDDRRFMSTYPDGIRHLVDMACQACWAAGGQVNETKLRFFRISLQRDHLQLKPGRLDLSTGPLSAQTRHLTFLGLPLLMSRSKSTIYLTISTRLKRLLQVFTKHRPSFLLVLRCVLTYCISKFDYIHDSIPCRPAALQPLQRQLHQTIRASLRLPQSLPVAALQAPLDHLGLGVPHLLSRGRIGLIRTLFSTLNSRNHILRAALRHLWTDSATHPIPDHDLKVAAATLGTYQITISFPPHPDLQAVTPHHHWMKRPPTWSPTILMSDGSVSPPAVAWAALVADSTGVLAECSAAVQVEGASSWMAEWLGRLQAMQLAADLGIPMAHVHWTLADNVAASAAIGGASPSSCAWLDVLRQHYQTWLAASGAREAYIPAQHNSHSHTPLAKWQQRCDLLARGALSDAQPAAAPFLHLLSDHCLFHLAGRLVGDLPTVLDTCYMSQAATFHPCSPHAIAYFDMNALVPAL